MTAPDATTKPRPVPAIDLRRCNACIICVDACPVECLTLSLARSGGPKRRYPRLVAEARCIGCGRCMQECPLDAIAMVPRTA
jgi:ferredoxin